MQEHSEDAEIARYASHRKPPKCETPHLVILHWSSSVELGITGYNTIQVGYGIAKTPTYPVMRRFPLLLYYVITIGHVTDRQTDRWTSCS